MEKFALLSDIVGIVSTVAGIVVMGLGRMGHLAEEERVDAVPRCSIMRGAVAIVASARKTGDDVVTISTSETYHPPQDPEQKVITLSKT